jgi:transposase
MSRPRNNLRKPSNQRSALGVLSAEQSATLQRWLVTEGVSYKTARNRLQSQFGVTVSIGTIQAYWHRVCVPQINPHPAEPGVTRRPRSQSPCKLDALKPDQLAQLQRWLVDSNISYKEACDRLQDRFGLKVNLATIFYFWHRVCAPIIMQRQAQPATPATPAAALEINLTIRQGDKVIGEARGSLPFSPPTIQPGAPLEPFPQPRS